MVMCKFFLQGTCKFGDYCRFDHQLPSSYTSFSDNAPSILRQPTFGGQQANVKSPPPSNVDISTLVKSVVTDSTSAEKGGQWLLSCYAPYKEKPALPGFIDQSFEEIRLGFYEAQKNGTLEQYKQQLQMMLQDVMMKVKSLQNPSPDIVNILKSIYNTPPSSSSGVFNGGNVPNNIFSNANTSSAIFGQQKPQINSQQAGNSIFANSSKNIFGGGPQQPSSNIFGGTSSIFSGAPPNQNIFATQTQNNASPFGNTQQNVFASQTAGKNIFTETNQALGNSGSIFGGQQSVSQLAFGQPQTQHASSPFGQQPITPFGQQTSPFNQNQTTSNSIFGGQNVVQPNSNTFANQATPFGQTNLFPVPNQTPFVQPSIAPQPNIASQPNIFGGKTGPMQPNLQMFANSLQNQNQPVFVQTDMPNASTGSPFGHSASIFGAPQANPSMNETPQIQQSFQQNVGQPNIFGGAQQNSVVDESLYSKLEELSEDDKKWFESDDLDVVNIPEEPPTFQMCFKV